MRIQASKAAAAAIMAAAALATVLPGGTGCVGSDVGQSGAGRDATGAGRP